MPLKALLFSKQKVMYAQRCRHDNTLNQRGFYELQQSGCEHYAQQSNRLKEAGTPIGGNDLWIAAHALVDESVLVTNSLREFKRIKGLKLEN